MVPPSDSVSAARSDHEDESMRIKKAREVPGLVFLFAICYLLFAIFLSHAAIVSVETVAPSGPKRT